MPSSGNELDDALESVQLLFEEPEAAESTEAPVAFYFKVVVDNNLAEDNSFQEVSGIQTEIQTESIEEGGSPFAYSVPLKIKNSNLVLKRGVAGSDSKLAYWCASVLEGGGFARPIKPANVQVWLLNDKGSAVRKWSFLNAYPVKWEVESFVSTKNELAIERMELCYTLLRRDM